MREPRTLSYCSILLQSLLLFNPNLFRKPAATHHNLQRKFICKPSCSFCWWTVALFCPASKCKCAGQWVHRAISYWEAALFSRYWYCWMACVSMIRIPVTSAVIFRLFRRDRQDRSSLKELLCYLWFRSCGWCGARITKTLWQNAISRSVTAGPGIRWWIWSGDGQYRRFYQAGNTAVSGGRLS